MNMNYKEKYDLWLYHPLVDDETKKELKGLSDDEIKERFYNELKFGTGGLRGIMGAGTGRMNVYTVRKATQGLAQYIISLGIQSVNKGVVIAYDSRNNSRLFAMECARVLSANGIKNYIFDDLRPTPELSFAVRYLGCEAGIVITASHNPKEYNGYKVYGSDGGQLPPEAADTIQNFINCVDIFDDVRITDTPNTVTVSTMVDDAYIQSVKAESLGEDIPDDFSVIYTPLHGSGNLPVRRILEEIGVKNVKVIESQEKPDGNFPTVKSPNPENKEAFDIAIQYAMKHPADLIFGTDPDSDRIGVVVKENDGAYTVLNGNQTGVLLCEYILRKTKEKNTPENARIIKTIVTTEMVRSIADDYGAKTVDVLTGFKYIGDKIKEYENSHENFIFGLEESYGYLKGTYARDKDAVVAAMLICELAAECKQKGMTLSDWLENLYKIYGYHKETLLNFEFPGIQGIERIKDIMRKFRLADKFDGEIKRIDYSQGVNGLPKSDVLKFFTKNSWFAVRPSGTEPKLKIYIGASGENENECDITLAKIKCLLRNYLD